MPQIKSRTYNSNLDIPIDQFPDTCPHCHFSISPQHVSTALDNKFVYLSFYCTRNDCNGYFIYEYSPSDHHIYYLSRALNGSPKGIKYSKIIMDISEDFVEIYHQSEKAEQMGLTDICGVGFRKSLEFLIKDYIIENNPELEHAVKNKLLAQCISEHIENRKIVEISKRAVWIGNDETHYVRKWEGMDINHLKQLIALTVHWIETEELTKSMIKDMPDPKKK